MSWYGGAGMGWLAWLGIGLMMIVFWGLVVLALVWLIRSRAAARKEEPLSARSPREILDERLARGELTEEEYVRRRDLLRTG
jgi:putative membrane protein